MRNDELQSGLNSPIVVSYGDRHIAISYIFRL